jgi:large subunit ribosomal protein L25
MRLKRTTKINLFINVEIAGEEECVGLKKGGTLNVLRPEIELVVTAADIPESIIVDITDLEVGDNITISSVKLPDGSKPVIDRDFVIAQVSAPSALVSSGDDEDGDDAAADAPAEGGEE